MDNQKFMAKNRNGIIILLVVALAFILRLIGSLHHLQDGTFFNETNFINKILTDYFSDPFPKQHLPLYMLIVFFVGKLYYGLGFLFGWFREFPDFLAFFHNSYSQFLMLGRLISVSMGSASVFLVYLTAKKLFNNRIAFIASLFLALAPLPIVESFKALPEATHSFFICLAFFYIARIFKQEAKQKEYIICGVFIGLAVATKYSGGLTVIPFILAHYFAGNKGTGRYLLSGILAMLAAIFVVSIPVLIHWDRFIAGISYNFPILFDKSFSRIYYAGGDLEKAGWLASLFGLKSALGIGLLLLSISGLLLGLFRRSKTDLLILSFIISDYIFLGNFRRFDISFLLPLVIFMIFLSASFLDFLHLKIIRSSRLLFALTLIFTLPSIYGSVHFLEWISQKDIYRDFYGWARENIKKGSVVLHDSRRDIFGPENYREISLFEFESINPDDFFNKNKIDYVIIDPDLPVALTFREFYIYLERHFKIAKEFRPAISAPAYNYYNLYGYYYNRPHRIYKCVAK